MVRLPAKQGKQNVQSQDTHDGRRNRCPWSLRASEGFQTGGFCPMSVEPPTLFADQYRQSDARTKTVVRDRVHKLSLSDVPNGVPTSITRQEPCMVPESWIGSTMNRPVCETGIDDSYSGYEAAKRLAPTGEFRLP